MTVSNEDMQGRLVATYGALLVVSHALDSFLNSRAGDVLDDASQSFIFGVRDVLQDVADQHSAMMNEF